MSKEDCVMWSMVGTKIYKKCAQVYKLEKRIKKLEAENAELKEWRRRWDAGATERKWKALGGSW